MPGPWCLCVFSLCCFYCLFLAGSLNILVTLKATTCLGHARGNQGSDGPELPVVVTTGGPGDMETEGPSSPPHLCFFSWMSPLLNLNQQQFLVFFERWKPLPPRQGLASTAQVISPRIQGRKFTTQRS